MVELDDTMRICVDYRKVNEVATFDAFPMPQIDDMIEKIGQAKYISMLDLTKGYWQISMASQNREKTAFSTSLGLFQFKRILLGCIKLWLHSSAQWIKS